MFSLIVIGTLAVGIATNIIVFGMADRLLFHPTPFARSEGLVQLWRATQREDRGVFSLGEFQDLQAQSRHLTAFACYAKTTANLKGDEFPERVEILNTSAGLSDTLGVKAQLGRLFLAEENGQGQGRVVVLGHAFWQSRFGGNPGVVNTSVVLDGTPHTVVGVLAPEAKFPLLWGKVDLWKPLELSVDVAQNRGMTFLNVIARLAGGSDLGAAQAETQTLSKRLAENFPITNKDASIRAMSLNRSVSGNGGPQILLLLFGITGFILLITCTNVANLLFARYSAREKETALRIALGAGRWRILEQFLLENMLLAVLAGLVGLFLARAALDLISGFVNIGGLERYEFPINIYVVAFSLVVSMAAGVLACILPAIKATRPNIAQTLKETGAGVGVSRRQQRLKGALVIAEVATAVVLLSGAALFVEKAFRLQGASRGYDSENVLTMSVVLPSSEYKEEARRAQFVEKLLASLTELPEVGVAAVSAGLPIMSSAARVSFLVRGQPWKEDEAPLANYDVVTPAYFEALKIPLVRGRVFEGRDDAKSPKVAVINEAMARRYWPGKEAIGQYVAKGKDAAGADWVQIVGVVANVRYPGNYFDFESKPQIYQSVFQDCPGRLSLMLRTKGSPASQAAPVRKAISRIDGSLATDEVQTMNAAIASARRNGQFITYIFAALAGIAGLLASVGLYGILSYMVSCNIREIGVRMAIGARGVDVVKLYLLRGMRLTLTGLTLGAVGGVAVAALMRKVLPGQNQLSPVFFVMVVLAFLLVCLLACVVPSMRSSRVDPLAALASR